jgi:hypothetical protein
MNQDHMILSIYIFFGPESSNKINGTTRDLVNNDGGNFFYRCKSHEGPGAFHKPQNIKAENHD